MELNHLRYFYEVARAGSFTAAARFLRVSQPSLSKTVALLEAREGVKLLERSKKGISLTKIGSEVYSQCEKIFSTVQEVKKICQGKKEVCEGYLRFGASDHVANYFLVSHITKMQTQHSLVVPSILVGAPHDLAQSILRGEIEFGLFFTKVADPQLSYEALAPIPLAVVCHPKFSARPKNTNEKIPHLYIGSIKGDYRKIPALELLQSLKLSPESLFETNSQELQKRLCLEGSGYAVLARFMVEEEIKKKTLIELPLPKEKVATLYIAKRKSHVLSLNARTFLELLRNEI